MVSAAPALDSRPAAEDRPFAQAAPWLAGLLGYAVVLLAPQVLNDGDSYWHVAAGGWMLDHARILRSDVFSFTFNGRPWHTHEWLAEVLMALAFRTAGWSGVILLYGAATGSAMVILARQLRRNLDGLALAVALLLAFACVTPSLLARPHLLALPLLVAWTAGLLRAREAERAPPLMLAALMTPWANLHGGFFLGLALIGPFALEALLAAPSGRRLACARAWALFGVASLAASLITPFGLSGLIFPIKLLGLSSLAGVTEWRPADFSRVGPLEISLIATLFVLLSRGVSIAPLRLALLLLLLHMSLQHSRHQMLLAVIGPMLIAQPLGRALQRVLAPGSGSAGPRINSGPPVRRPRAFPGSLEPGNALTFLCWRASSSPNRTHFGGKRARRAWALGGAVAVLVLASARLAWPIVRLDGPSSPITALKHVPAALRRMPVLNDYGMGGYLIFEGVRPFIDGRTDMYGDAFTNAYLRAERPDLGTLDSLIARWGVRWTLLNPQDPLTQVMDRRPNWRRLYADRYAVIHVREGEAR